MGDPFAKLVDLAELADAIVDEVYGSAEVEPKPREEALEEVRKIVERMKEVLER